MRIRVSIDLRVPLKRRMKLKMAGDEWFWINFKYENVPTFCFICGVVGHSEKFCSKLFEMPENDIIKPYGPWMRAPFRNQVKPIGARWLRNGMDAGGSSSGMDLHGVASGKDEANHDPQKSPVIAGTGRQGEISGISNFQNVISGAGNEIGNNTVTDSQIIKEQLKKKGYFYYRNEEKKDG